MSTGGILPGRSGSRDAREPGSKLVRDVRVPTAQPYMRCSAHLPSHQEGGWDHVTGGSDATPDWKETEKAPVPNGEDGPTRDVGAHAVGSAKASDVTG